MKTLEDFKADFKVVTDHAQTYPNPFMAANFASASIKMIIDSEYKHIEKECEEFIKRTVDEKLESLGITKDEAIRNVVNNVFNDIINGLRKSKDHCGNSDCTVCNTTFGKQDKKKANGDKVVPFPNSGIKH